MKRQRHAIRRAVICAQGRVQWVSDCSSRILGRHAFRKLARKNLAYWRSIDSAAALTIRTVGREP